MDLVKEIQELKQAIVDAMEDEKISLREAIHILREAADVLAIILPLVLVKTYQTENEAEKAA